MMAYIYVCNCCSSGASRNCTCGHKYEQKQETEPKQLLNPMYVYFLKNKKNKETLLITIPM